MITQEIKKYKQLTLDEKEQYVKESYEIQAKVESELKLAFGNDNLDVAEIYIEQFRDYAQLPVVKLKDLTAIPCSRKVAYDVIKNTLPAIIDANEVVSSTRKNIKIRNKKRDKKNKDTEFMNFMRSYGKYWSKYIDENEGNCETGDLEWVKTQMKW